MSMKREILSDMQQHLAAGRPFAVATIISQQGSTPRMPGTKMVVAEDGTSRGTVGGGLLEAAVIERAAQVLETGVPVQMRFKLTAKARETMDMICGGVAEVLIDRIDPAAPSGGCLARWCRLCAEAGAGVLVTVIEEKSEERITTAHHILDDPSPPPAGERLDLKALMAQAAAAATQPQSMAVVRSGALKGVVEFFQPPEPLLIFGAGHVSQPTAHLAHMVGFRVVVLDDRAEFANRERFPEAERVVVLDDYHRAMGDLRLDAESFIVIVTRGHLHDQTVLAQALRTPAAYIGMIGSRTKRDTIYSNLRRQGFNEADLKRVASPIGLSIRAQTPEEIAVSIVAQMIQRRSEIRS
jgi:xanthine dehydrogenase accessory factor